MSSPATNPTGLTGAISELGLDVRSEKAFENALGAEFSDVSASENDLRALGRVAYIFEREGISAAQDPQKDTQDIFGRAFACWWSLASAYLGKSKTAPAVRKIVQEIAIEQTPDELVLAFHLAAAGMLSGNTAETRLRLTEFNLVASEDDDWKVRVRNNVLVAFALLVRKQGGWRDIESAIIILESLKKDQAEYEGKYLSSVDSKIEMSTALQLVGYYHLAQMLVIVSTYLKDGAQGRASVQLKLDRHRRQAAEAFGRSLQGEVQHIVDLLWLGGSELTRNSMWSHIEALPERVRVFGEELIKRDNPVLELWPAQQEALRKNLLDTYHRAILVEMPTSAGKTLLAKFSIVQTKSLNPSGTVAYVVPTRALVNQVTHELRRDFEQLKLTVEFAVPAFELDPTESQLLTEKIDVLVTTAEKLDLLIRSDHPCTRELALIVADEAHNLVDGLRGARLELLLGTIKREKRNTRFLLLSPFLPNGEELVSWLGDERGLPPIRIDWRPNRKIVGTVRAEGRESKRRLVLTALPAAHNSLSEGHKVAIGNEKDVPEKNTVSRISRAIAGAICRQNRGGTLILCKGKGTAMKRARELYKDRDEIKKPSARLNAVCQFLSEEAGFEPLIVKCLRRGVAYHHAGLSQEARWLIEGLVSSGEIDTVCGTTTLAQGVNFPISTVVVESLKKGEQNLSYSDFWNIAGRAGRALMDAMGVVAFPAKSPKAINEYRSFLKGEAELISSQLAQLIVAAEDISRDFNLSSLRNWPHLSALLQFFAHAVKVAGHSNVADQIEDVLRSSLIYHQGLRRGLHGNNNRLIGLCRAYVDRLKGQDAGMIALADSTGFSTPSAFYLFAQAHQQKDLIDPNTWKPEQLFASGDEGLKRRIDLIAGIPEMRLGDGHGGPLDTQRTASILKDWVRGESLIVLTRKYALKSEDAKKSDDIEVAEFSSYLFSSLLGNASWGLGALEGVCLSGKPELKEAVGHIPSMVYFGVRSPEAVVLRMAGVPRVAAEGLAKLWRERNVPQPKSYREIRGWVNNLSHKDWEAALIGTQMSPGSMSTIWQQIAGVN